MDALKYLQKALDAGTVRMQRCEIYPNLRVLVDEPNGDLRLTYAKVIAGTVQSIAVSSLRNRSAALAAFPWVLPLRNPFVVSAWQKKS
jgi:hypothetical protein